MLLNLASLLQVLRGLGLAWSLETILRFTFNWNWTFFSIVWFAKNTWIAFARASLAASASAAIARWVCCWKMLLFISSKILHLFLWKLSIFVYAILVFVFNNCLKNCVTQLKLYILDELSSPIFCCLSVSVSGNGNTWPDLHFFNIYKHKNPLLSLWVTWSSFSWLSWFYS